MKILNMTSYSSPPHDVEHVVTIGFIVIWLTRNSKEKNGIDGKMFYPHYATLDAYRWLFDETTTSRTRKWKTVEKFRADAEKALRKRLKECNEELLK